MLGDQLRSRRRELGLSLREAARRIGISPAYLSSVEHGRNPSTGRAPVPSAVVLAAIARVLGLELETLLELAGAAPAASAHVLLIQLGAARCPVLYGARRGVTTHVDRWLEVPARKLTAQIVAAAAATDPFGLVFGATARPLARGADPAGLLAEERTWEEDIARTCVAAGAGPPAANVCVYRETDIRGVRTGDPLAVALALVGSHPHVAAQADDGTVIRGAEAVEALLTELRPDGISAPTWSVIAAATARGIGQGTPAR
jgi:transcriptional regulator with XRE-family HTH domain